MKSMTAAYTTTRKGLEIGNQEKTQEHAKPCSITGCDSVILSTLKLEVSGYSNTQMSEGPTAAFRLAGG